MTLLAPMSALVGALVALPLVLALYLLKLRRRPVRVGSMRFWPAASEDVQANVPLRWLRLSWLLVLHVLMLACLVLALGRPAIAGSGLSGDRIVLLIDASASMSAVDEPGGPTRLERAKRRAKELCEQSAGGWFSPARSIAVVSFAHRPRVVSGFTTSPTMLAALIDAIEPTDQPGDVAAALQLANALAREGLANEDASTQASPAALVLLGDGSYHSDAARAEDSPLQSASPLSFEHVGPAGDEAPVNAGVTAIAARRDARDPVLVRVFARVAHNQLARRDVIVTLAMDGQVVARRSVLLEPAERGGLGSSEVVFETRRPGPAICTVRVETPGDAFASDSSASVAIDGAASPRIALVRDTSPGAAPAWLLSDVLRELGGGEPATLTLAQAEDAGATWDVLVFDRCAPARLPNAATISLGRVPPLSRVRVGTQVVRPRPMALAWDRDHPVMGGITLDTLVVRQAQAIVIEPARADQPLVPEPIVLARSDDAPLIVLASEGGAEHLVVAFALEDSNWPLQAGFAVFLANATEHLAAASSGRLSRSFRTIDAVMVRVPASSDVTLVGPREVVLRQDATGGGALAEDGLARSAGVLDRAGVYVVRGGGSEAPGMDRAVCVNLLDATESALAAPRAVRVDGVALEGVAQGAAPREIWQWFVLGVLALLLLEWVVYAFKARV